METFKPATLEERKRVYKEAIQCIKTKTFVSRMKSFGLCLLLPCLLWKLNWLLNDAPNGEPWDSNTIYTLFPEINEEDIYNLNELHEQEIRNELRIKILEKALEQVEELILNTK